MHDSRLHLSRDRGRPPRARRVLAKRIDATVQEALAPQRHLAAIKADLNGDVLVLQTLGGQQDYQRPLMKSYLNSSALGQHAKLPLGVLVQFDRLGNSHRSSLLGDWSRQLSSITSRALH